MVTYPMRAAAVCASSVLGVIDAAHAAETTTLIPVRDTSINDIVPANSSGAGRFVFVGRTGEPGGFATLRGLLHFDVATRVPAGSIVTGATLTVTVEASAPKSGPRTHALHRALADWGEGASDASGGDLVEAEPGDATWLHRFFPDVVWARDGGEFHETPSAEFIIGEETGTYSSESAPGLVDDVQAFIDGAVPEYGWVLRGDEVDVLTARRLASRHTFNPGTEPTLRICTLASPCEIDFDADGFIGFRDLLFLLTEWNGAGVADLNCSGAVDTSDLLLVIEHWGPCS